MGLDCLRNGAHSNYYRLKALQVLKDAFELSNEQIWKNAMSALKVVKIHYPEKNSIPNYPLNLCATKKVDAFILRGGNQIWICPHLWEAKKYTKNQATWLAREKIIQVLIHETVHILRIEDECLATYWELRAMALATGHRITQKNRPPPLVFSSGFMHNPLCNAYKQKFTISINDTSENFNRLYNWQRK